MAYRRTGKAIRAKTTVPLLSIISFRAIHPAMHRSGKSEGAAGKPATPRPTPPRRGRRMPGGRVGIRRGRALRPVPRVRPPAGATDASGSPHSSGVAERQSDELRSFARLHPKQHRVLALLARLRKLLADVSRVRNRLAADIENHVADLKAVIGGDAVRIDRGDDHAIASEPALFAGASVRPSFGMSLSRDLALVLLVGGLLLVGQRAQRQRHGLFLALVDQAELD